ncbi:Glutaconyl-CoA decarboxylase subunit gamma [Planctomycetes bacterium Poly30]|uniref:Glutaconyl-CoA decarboxylase subunit gamma n=1 Tax=Saltatorellus ferox TaxID=2528018 RepID=A0A518EWK1_9BACT|nr:Glutaconyl-CoA decarboxylase subunit gamma [Planctomycetes bacterium Poly30]
MKTFVQIGETTHQVEVTERLGELQVLLNGEPCELEYNEADNLGQIILMHGGKSYAMSMEGTPHDISVTLAGYRYDCELEDERERAANLAAKAANKGGGVLKAVMPGVVVELLVAEGDEVTEGQPLLILEAMKMQNEIPAGGDGIVKAIHASAGTAVAAGDKLITLAAKEDA